MMNVFVCVGEWMVEERWEFVVDATRGGRMLVVEDDVGLTEFVKLVCEEYDLSEDADSIDVAYELPENVMQKMPKGTPPVYVTKDSQLKIFLNINKTEVVRLCVSKKKDVGHSSRRRTYREGTYDDDDRDGYNDDTDSRDDVENYNEVENCNEDDDEDTSDADGDGDDGVGDEETVNEWNTHEGVNISDDRKCVNVPVVAGEESHESASCGIIEVGDIFENKAELINKLRRLTILQNFDFNIIKSTKTLFVAKCFVVGCSWMIRVTSMSSTATDFIVRTMVCLHTCSAAMRYGRHRQATAKCIGKLYLEKFGGNGLLKGIKPRHLMDTMKAVYGLDIEYSKAFAALRHARQLLRGTAEDGYNELPKYLHLIRKANPGTITRLECDGENRFKYLFFAFSASIEGFQFVRKVVVVDGTHLHGKFQGTLLVAAAQDGNSSIFPLAFGVVDSENDASWEWFFVQLQAVVANARGLAFISDRHKSIAKAIAKVFPDAPRGICTYHLGQNIRARFKGTKILNLFKRASKVGRVSEFNSLFEVIRRQDKSLADYLESADIRQWSRAHFPGVRYNIMTSNICESINAALKEAREFPIAFFVDHVRAMLSHWFNDRKEAAGLLEGLFSPKVESKVCERT